MITMVAALAETMHLCEVMGLDQQQFIALLDGGPLGSAFALQELGEMRRHHYPQASQFASPSRTCSSSMKYSRTPQPQCAPGRSTQPLHEPPTRSSPTKTWPQSTSLTHRSRPRQPVLRGAAGSECAGRLGAGS